MDQRERHYLELLTKRFNESDYIDFIKDLLNLSQFDISNTLEQRTDIPKQYKENIDYYKYIAKYNDGLNNIGILIVKLNDKVSTNSRTAQRNFIATILSKYDLDASIVAFYSNTENNWRLSFVKKELNFTEKGFKVELTPAKRYSYLVGENESVHTAQEFLLKLLKINDRKINIEDIEQVFDVEKVTKKFFEEYKEKYLQLKEYLDENEDFKTESKKADFTSVEFAKKLMGQIVFLYFLQKKGWLGVQLVPNELNLIEFRELLKNSDSVSKKLLNDFFEKQEDFYVINKTKLKTTDSIEDIINLSNLFSKTSYDRSWGTGKKDFIRSMYRQAIKEHKNFFDDYLEPFFYRGLNEKRENQYFPLFNCKIPFLNGGLFEPINNYRWSSAHFNIPNKLFSNYNRDGILDFLDLYNFTIDEEEPLEKEIAVDPEMLGKIFENLLDIDDRKSKGAFYTPREIVYYMCQESIANYLVNKVGVDYNEIKQFIKYGDLISQIDWETSIKNETNFEIGHTIYENILKIDHALLNVKIADPAVGSGAFPLGMLTEIIKIRDNLTVYMMIQNELGIININELYGTEHEKRDIFDMKLQTIENCLYAVDLEPSAIDIAKLRLWLSLIVDYPNDEEPKPLPNLDCKIMQGNSLVDEYQNVPLFSEKILNNNLKKYKRNESKMGIVNDIHIQQSLQFEDSINLNDYIDKMLQLQKEYFITSDNKIKRNLKEKIDTIQICMIEESLKNDSKKLAAFKIESQKHQKPWFIWKLEFFDVFKNNGGFDIVIGNPPYGANIDSEIKFYEKKFPDTSHGFKDIYKYFVNLALSFLLNENGLLCFITPNTYFRQPRYSDLRKYLLNYKIDKLVNLGANVFDASVLTAIMFVNKKSRKNNIINYSDLSENSLYNGNISSITYTPIEQKSFEKNDSYVFSTSIVLEKDEIAFGQIIIPKDAGINYQRVKVGLGEKGKSDLSSRLLYEGIKENDSDVEYWKGTDIDSFKIKQQTNRYCRINIPLKENERVILNKDYFMIVPKILWRQTASYPIAVIDNVGRWFGRSIQSGIINPDYKDLFSEKYICCLLNSKYIRYLYIKSVEEVGRVFPQVKLEKLKPLPIKKVSNDILLKFEKLYDQLSSSIDKEYDKLYDELNELVYNVYGLTREEINNIENSY